MKYVTCTINILLPFCRIKYIYIKNFSCMYYISFFFLFWNYKMTSVLLFQSIDSSCLCDLLKRTLVCILSISKLQNYVCLLTTFEACFMPFQSTGNPLFCSVNGFATFRAFWMFHGLERHFYTEKKILLLDISYCIKINHKVSHRHV